MKEAHCDKCKAAILIKLEEEELKDNISRVFFRCNNCGEEYLVHYTSVLVKIKQRKIVNIANNYEKIRDKDYVAAEKLFKKYQNLKKEIGKDMDKLKKRMGG